MSRNDIKDKVKLLRYLKDLLEDKEIRTLLTNMLLSDNKRIENEVFNGKILGSGPCDRGSNPRGASFIYFISVKNEDIEEFRRYLVALNLHKNHIDMLYYRIRKLLRYTNNIISKDILLEAFNKLKSEGLSDKSISNYKNALVKFLEFLEEKYNLNNLKQEIMSEINKYYKWKKSVRIDINQLLNSLDKENVIKGFNNLVKDDERLLYSLLTVTGLRKSEALSIRLENIDFDNRIIFLNMIRRTKRVYFVFFNSFVKDLLEDYVNKRSLSNKDLIFKFSVRRFYNLFRRASYNNTKITAQSLRKFFATYSIENGMNPLFVDFLQGRIDYSILMRHYFRPPIKSLRKEYDKVWENFFS